MPTTASRLFESDKVTPFDKYKSLKLLIRTLMGYVLPGDCFVDLETRLKGIAYRDKKTNHFFTNTAYLSIVSGQAAEDYIEPVDRHLSVSFIHPICVQCQSSHS